MIPLAIRRRLAASFAALLRPAHAVTATLRQHSSALPPTEPPPAALAAPTESFHPDPVVPAFTAPSCPDASAAYRLWIDTVEQVARSGAVYTRAAELAGELRYSLLLPDAPDAVAVARTLESLVAQNNLCWELLLPGTASSAVRRGVASFAADTAERVAFVACNGDEDRGAVLDRLLAAAGGGWISALGANDVLARHALDEFDVALGRNPRARIVYSDEDELDAAGERANPLFKPEYAPEQLQAFNYFGRLTFINRCLAISVGGFGAGRGAGAEWSLNLRAADAATAGGGEVCRIPRVLCHRDPGGGSDRCKPRQRCGDPA